MSLDLAQTGGFLARFEVRRIDVSERQPVYLLTSPTGANLRITSSAYLLLRKVAEGASLEDLAATLSEQRETPVSTESLQRLYDSLRQRISTLDENRTPLRGGFWLRLPLLPARLVDRLAQPLSLAFHPWVATILLAAIAIAGVALWTSGARLGQHDFWLGYGLFLVSLLAHELGHASACRYHSAPPGEIGFTFYVIYPSFYSDVDAAWTLRRWQRVVVDLGGIYFQLAIGAIYTFLLLWSGWEPFGVALALIAGSCAFSLNPILKFDGYWVVADALGVTNLSRQMPRLLRHVAARLHGRETDPLPWPVGIVVALSIYTLVVCAAFVLFLVLLGPRLAEVVGRSIDLTLALLAQPDVGRAVSTSRLLGQLATTLFVLLFLATILVRVARLGGALLRGLRRRPR